MPAIHIKKWFLGWLLLSYAVCTLAQSDTTALPVRLSPQSASQAMGYVQRIGSNPFSPMEAAKRSAALPGWGQLYNKKLWKIPIIYAGGIAIGYGIYWNQTYYQYFDQLYKQAILTGNPEQLNLNRLRYLRSFTRRNKELLILGAIALYALNIVDAIVDAHLAAFDLDDNISLRFYPQLSPDPYQQVWVKGITFTVQF